MDLSEVPEVSPDSGPVCFMKIDWRHLQEMLVMELELVLGEF